MRKIRITRVLTYEGEYPDLVKHLQQRMVKGVFDGGKVTISESFGALDVVHDTTPLTNDEAADLITDINAEGE